MQLVPYDFKSIPSLDYERRIGTEKEQVRVKAK